MQTYFEKENCIWKLKKLDLKIREANEHLKNVKSFKLTKTFQNIIALDKQEITRDMKLIAEKIGKGIENYFLVSLLFAFYIKAVLRNNVSQANRA